MKRLLSTLLLSLVFLTPLTAQDTLYSPGVDALLYGKNNSKKPLVVGLGGSEGGNAWASNYWKKTRDRFLDSGYAFLALGYFRTRHSRPELELIALEQVYAAIQQAKQFAYVDSTRIIIVGGSRGADLGLLLASYYSDIDAVVALSASHAVFPGNTNRLNQSSFTWKNEPLPFVPVVKAAYPFLLKRDLRRAFEVMLQDTAAEQKALIKVENVNGPILFISGTEDEVCPSSEMCDKMVIRLKEKGFKHHYEQLKVKGGHGQPLQYFDYVFGFLNRVFSKT